MSGGVSPTGNGSGGGDRHTQSCRSGGAIGAFGAGVATDYTNTDTSPRHGTSIEPYSHTGFGLHERSSVAHGRAHYAHPEPEPRPRPSHASAPWRMAMAVDHREPPPDRSSHDSAAAGDDHREMGIRTIAIRSSSLTRGEAAVFLGAHIAASSRPRQGRRGGQCWNTTLDRGDVWNLPTSWQGLWRVGYHNGINCTLAFNRRWFQHVALRRWHSDVKKKTYLHARNPCTL